MLVAEESIRDRQVSPRERRSTEPIRLQQPATPPSTYSLSHTLGRLYQTRSRTSIGHAHRSLADRLRRSLVVLSRTRYTLSSSPRIRLCFRIVALDSVLRFLRRLQSSSCLIELLCDAAYRFDPSYLAECTELNEQTKKEIYRRATTPCSLKNIARKQIRAHIFESPMKLRIDRAAEQLDLPVFLRRYLLFQ